MMNCWLARIALMLHAAVLPFAALAQQATVSGDVTVEGAWTRAASSDDGSAAVYFTLRNTGQTTIDLIGVRADIASIEVLHKTVAGSTGVPRMSAVPELKVVPGATVSLEPGGLHVMLIDLEMPLVEGETLPLRLKFYDGDDLANEVPILGSGATGPNE